MLSEIVDRDDLMISRGYEDETSRGKKFASFILTFGATTICMTKIGCLPILVSSSERVKNARASRRSVGSSRRIGFHRSHSKSSLSPACTC